jgi:predicted enzyme related to lactoylglutathione lyase
MVERIDYIEFPSPDRQATHDFFARAFGWKQVDFGPGYGAIEGAGIDGGVDQTEGRVAATMAVIRTDDLDAAEARVLAAGGEITRPQYDFPGGRRFHFREPGGNELAVYIERA